MNCCAIVTAEDKKTNNEKSISPNFPGNCSAERSKMAKCNSTGISIFFSTAATANEYLDPSGMTESVCMINGFSTKKHGAEY